MNSKQKILSILEKNKNYLRSNYFVKEIGLFGSYVSESEKNESDIDIIVELEKGHNDLFNYERLNRFLQDLFGKEVDLVIKNSIRKELKKEILEQVEYV